jgi:hypothetical protein
MLSPSIASVAIAARLTSSSSSISSHIYLQVSSYPIMPQRPAFQAWRIMPMPEEPPAKEPEPQEPAPNGTAEDLSSPARGKEMRSFVLARLRPPPLVHSWEFWHDRQDRKPPADAIFRARESARDYEARLVPLATVGDVRAFWEVFNNFDLASLQLRDSVHLFHRGVKPVWEDPRNTRGGAWTFRVPRESAGEFWKMVAMLAIGETLQACVASKRISEAPDRRIGKKLTGAAFIDDICGVSLSVRFTSTLVQVWNRDGDHEEGIQKILKAVLEELPPDLQLREHQYYYKKHSEHSAFKASPSDNEPVAVNGEAERPPATLQKA